MPRPLFKKYPVYIPDATRGVVKSLDSMDLKNIGIEGVVVNTYHLFEYPGVENINRFGGIKKLMNYNGVVVSDSGGWQVFSLIHRNGNKLGKITDKGVNFGSGKVFTPEESIQTQIALNSDIVICLDDFTNPTAPLERIKESVDRTVLWAKRSKIEFDRLCIEKGYNESNRPHLLAVIQGDRNKDLRKDCADRLIEIGFDAYGFGGYVIDADSHKLDLDIAKFVAELIPNDKIKFALGTGSPQDIVACTKFGWQIFDCTLPTRDARHKRLYIFNESPTKENLENENIHGFLYIGSGKYKTDTKPIDETCGCHTCKNFTRAYIYHLFKINDLSALRLAQIHNLRHYTRICLMLQA